MKTFMLLILMSVPSFAAEVCEAPGSFEMPSPLVQAIDAVALLRKTVTRTQYENAPCKTLEVPEYDWWLENKSGDTRRDGQVKGFNFDDQPEELINAFRDITQNMPARNSSCTTVLCAVDEIWGAQVGRKILYIRARHGFNTSELVYPDTRRFSSSELDDIIITLGDLPPELEMIGQQKNQRMSLEAEYIVPKHRDTVADSTIKFFNRWRITSDQFGRSYSLFHEFAHNVSFMKRENKRDNKGLDSSEKWLSIPSCPVSTYGEEDRGEDFAESFVMYRFNGPGLKQKCPEKYNFLKKEAFNNREFLDGSQCY